MRTTREYGNCGAGHGRAIDGYLSALRPAAHVLHLGCGANVRGEIDNLADRLSAYSRGRARLLAADRPEMIDHLRKSLEQGLGYGRPLIDALEIDATDMSGEIATATIDLVLALGLFGELRFGSDQKTSSFDDPGVRAATDRVLGECFRVLKPGGTMLISNSCVRQPEDVFTGLALQVGFRRLDSLIAFAAEGYENREHERYLLVLLRPAES